MLTAELSAGFLVVLYLIHRAGLDPRALTSVPPLDLLAMTGGAGASIAEFLAYLLLFAAYEVMLLASLVVIGALIDGAGAERVRLSLSRGRDTTGIRPLIWLTLVSTPLIAAEILMFGQPSGRPRLLFVAILITLTAAQTLRPFTVGDVWRGLRRLDASLRELTRPGRPAPAPAPTVTGRPRPGNPPPRRTAGGGRGWLAVTRWRRGRVEESDDRLPR